MRTDILNFLLLNTNNRREEKIKEQFPDDYKEFSSWIFPDNFSFTQKMYHFINDDKELSLGLCKICGKRCSWRGLSTTYLKYCSKKCSYESEERKKNIQKAFANKTDEEKKLISDKHKEIQNKVTKEKRKEIINKRLKTLKEKGDNFINEFRKRQKESLINTLNSRTEKEKKEDSLRKSICWKNKSDLEKSIQIEKMHIGLTKFHENEIKHKTWKENVNLANKSKSKTKIEEGKNKEWETKIKNGNINTSSSETEFKNWLIENNINFYQNYNGDHRYPYHVDFYLPKYDLFIEIQAHWTHGQHKFNENDINDKNTLKSWKEKSKHSKFYNSAIDVWTIRDKEKRNTAENNNINYLEIFSNDINIIIKKVKELIDI